MCTEIEEYEKHIETKPNFSFHQENKMVSNSNKMKLFIKISNLLQNLISIEKELKQKNSENNFDVDYVPSLSILDYLKRLDVYLNFNEDMYYTALIYLDRFIARNKFHLSYSNVYNVIISSLLISSKFYHDVMYNNAGFAKIAGISNSELNTLEMEFYKAIDFNLFIDSTAFKNYIQKFNDFF